MTSALDIALRYIAEGWAPIPIPYMEKAPRTGDGSGAGPGWGNRRIDAASAPAWFNGAPQNIGVLLGEASGGLTDVDLDCEEAVRIAPYVLPRTRCFGRASKRMSHWLYYTDLWKTTGKATIARKDAAKRTLIECRVGSSAAQTIFPGSTHPSGELVTWEDQNAIAQVDGSDLETRCRWVAILALLARSFPTVGGRHDAGLIMGSFFARCGLTKGTAELYAEAVAVAAGQPRDKVKDIARAAGASVEDMAAGKRGLYGYPALAGAFGAWTADRAAEWGGFKGAKNGSADAAAAAEESAALFGEASEAAAGIRATGFDFAAASAVGPRQSLYAGHYVRQFLSSTIAPSKVGKTSLIICEALAMASGKPLLGVQPVGALRVWLWNGEDPLDELQRRIMACMRLYGLTADDLGDRLFVDTGRRMPVVLATQTRNGAVIAEPVENALISTILENRIDVVQIDPFISSHRVSENDNNAIDLVAKRWSAIADTTRCAIEAPHHSRKLNGMEVSVEDGRGASALLAAVRSSRALARMTKDEARALGLTDDARRLFRFTEVSSNLSIPAPDSQQWLELVSVRLENGNGEDEMDKIINGDSVGVVRVFDATGARQAAVAEAVGDHDSEAAVMAAIRTQEWRLSDKAENWVGVPIAQTLGLDRTSKEGRAQIRALVSEWTKQGKLREENRLNRARQVKTFVVVAEPETDPGDLFG
jgi:hypothetical protein